MAHAPAPDDSDEVHAIAYNRAGAPLRRAIADLQHRAAPDAVPPPPPEDPVPPEHDPALDALAFYLVAQGQVVSYAAVVHVQIAHGGAPLLAAGLSCVATDPVYQRRGLGTRVVAAATRAIVHSAADIGVFTCDPPLAGFYARAGGWERAPGATLLGNRHPGALSSAALGKAVLLRLLSPRALALADELRHGTIDLGLPPGQFL